MKMKKKNLLLFLLLFCLPKILFSIDIGIGLPSIVDKKVENLQKKVSKIIKPQEIEVIKIEILPSTYVVVSLNQQIKFEANGRDKDNNIVQITPQWVVEGGIGVINNYGVFTATSVGRGYVKALYDNLSVRSEVVVISTSSINNIPPVKPIVSGKTKIFVNSQELFSFYSEDTDGDKFYFVIDWGDGNISSTTYVSSSSTESLAVAHVYQSTGVYHIKAKAVDDKDNSSEWSEDFIVEVFQEKLLYKLNVSITPTNAGYVSVQPLKTEGYEYGEIVTITAYANPGFVFSKWDKNGTEILQNPIEIEIKEDTSISAIFISSGSAGQVCQLSVLVGPAGAGNVITNPQGTSFSLGTEVTLYAVANSGYKFTQWSGDITGTQNPITITLDSDKVVVANFVLADKYKVNVNILPTGAGYVEIQPFSSDNTFVEGTTITLRAYSNSGYKFKNWSGDISGASSVVQVVVTKEMYITANFEETTNGGISYTISVSVSPQNAGSVELNPVGGVYPENTQVVLTAVSNPGYVFTRWSGDVVSSSNPVTIVVNTNKNIVANFEQQVMYNLIADVFPYNSGEVQFSTPGVMFPAGTKNILTAVPYNGYGFLMWLGDGIFSKENPYEITIDKNLYLKSYFIRTSGGISFNVYSDQGTAGFIGAFNSASSFNISQDNSVYAEGTFSMKATISGSLEESYGGWYVEEGAAGGNETRDMSSYSEGYLKFWLKTPIPSSQVVVGIFSINLSPDTAKSKLTLDKYGFVSNNTWQEVFIPLQDFKNKEANLDFASINVFFSISVVGPTNGEENFWVDDVKWTTGENDTPPTIYIQNLTNGATVSGTTEIVAVANDDKGINKVEFYIDDQLKYIDNSSPYSYIWYTTSTTNGYHSIKLIAYDTIMQSSVTQIGVYVNNIANDNPPNVSITNLQNGTTVQGTIVVEVAASDDKGISKVEFYIDNVLKYTDSSSPYSWSWDTTSTVIGWHVLKVVAYDTVDQTASQQINVNVNNTTYTLNIYNDSGISGNDIWTWSDNNLGSFVDTSDPTAPEGSKSFMTNTNSGSWAGWGVVYTPNKANLSQYSGGYLRFWVKTPVNLKVEIRDTTLRGPRYISQYGWNGSNTWQEITIPLSDFGSIDFTNIELPFMITCETQAVFYVDDVRWLR